MRRSLEAYSREKDGPLGQYLYDRNLDQFSVFNGVEDYEMLRRNGLIKPGVTMVRIVWGSGNDEFYNVCEDFRLEGVVGIEDHEGLPGIHDPEKIFERNFGDRYVNWEPHSPDFTELQRMIEAGE